MLWGVYSGLAAPKNPKFSHPGLPELPGQGFGRTGFLELHLALVRVRNQK